MITTKVQTFYDEDYEKFKNAKEPEQSEIVESEMQIGDMTSELNVPSEDTCTHNVTMTARSHHELQIK